MHYTVKQLADLAGVSRRALHFYDETGLLKPARCGENGYRYYGEEALLRLQQILFYKELGFSLAEIKEILDRPGFDVRQALQAHRKALQERVVRLNRLIDTVDKTVLHLEEGLEMSEREYYDGFGEETHRKYRAEAIERYGEDAVVRSEKRWNSYTREQKEAIWSGMGLIFRSLRDNMSKGHDHPDVQELVKALHKHMGFFYDCTLEIFAGLGRMYSEDPRFADMYRTQYHPDMPEFLTRAMTYYCEVQSGKKKA